MITVFHSDTTHIPDDEIEMYLDLLPLSMSQEIMRYKYIADQKCRLLARLMLQQCLTRDGVPELINEVQRDRHNKPFIDGWHFFNISHSGDLVVLAKGTHINPVGIDTEKRTHVDFRDIIHSFHPEEQAFIHRSPDTRRAFFEVWVKKEAFLKATGLGIVHGLGEFSCLCESISYNGTWRFYPVHIYPGYVTFVCSQDEPHPLDDPSVPIRRRYICGECIRSDRRLN